MQIEDQMHDDNKQHLLNIMCVVNSKRSAQLNFCSNSKCGICTVYTVSLWHFHTQKNKNEMKKTKQNINSENKYNPAQKALKRGCVLFIYLFIFQEQAR